jgi:hypothetical protein
MAGESLAEKIAAVDKLIDEFELHSKRVQEILREAGEKFGTLTQVAKEHGGEGITAVLALFQRFQRIAARAQTVQSDGISSVV